MSPRTRDPENRSPAVQALWLAAFLAIAVAVWLWIVPYQFTRGCWIGDWPFENGCPATPMGASTDTTPGAYREYLAENVGDSRAYVWLVRALWNSGQQAQARALLPSALALSPTHAFVLALAAEDQLQSQDWDGAAAALVKLLERGEPEARKTLLALMANPATRDSVLKQLNPASDWLDPLLRSAGKDIPAPALQPFVARGRELRLLSSNTVLTLIDRLQSQNAWIDAYSLWLGWVGATRPGLYDGAFDGTPIRRGFDWIWTEQPPRTRAFELAFTSAAPRPGSMMEVRLTGHGTLPTPIVKQIVILPGRGYRLRGHYRADQLNTRGGLVWALRCAGGGNRFAETPAIMSTARQWEAIDLAFSPPPDCQTAVQLGLETQGAWEARAGITGTVSFDDFSITPDSKTAIAVQRDTETR